MKCAAHVGAASGSVQVNAKPQAHRYCEFMRLMNFEQTGHRSISKQLCLGQLIDRGKHQVGSRISLSLRQLEHTRAKVDIPCRISVET